MTRYLVVTTVLFATACGTAEFREEKTGPAPDTAKEQVKPAAEPTKAEEPTKPANPPSALAAWDSHFAAEILKSCPLSTPISQASIGEAFTLDATIQKFDVGENSEQPLAGKPVKVTLKTIQGAITANIDFIMQNEHRFITGVPAKKEASAILKTSVDKTTSGDLHFVSYEAAYRNVSTYILVRNGEIIAILVKDRSSLTPPSQRDPARGGSEDLLWKDRVVNTAFCVTSLK